MPKVCIINVVGLTPELLPHATGLQNLSARAGFGVAPWTGPLPAVTSTAQATMLTGAPPSEHGIVANGWFYRETQEIRFWQQANSLLQRRPFYDRFETANMFWWFNQSSSAKYSVTPKPHYGCDGSKQFGILDYSGCDLVNRLGPFPFASFWGPNAGLPSSRWIAQASALVLQEQQPEVTLVYLPHLDYDFQRHSHPGEQPVRDVDSCAMIVVDAALSVGATPIVVSEYGLTPVNQPVHINRVLRQAGWLRVRGGPFGEMLMPGESPAFAVADHQVAHIYVKDRQRIPEVRRLLAGTAGISQVVEPTEVALNHPRSGELIALADSQAWFTYYYWLDDRLAPDFAPTVDIHRKPGYDPCELFITSRFKAMRRLFRKKIGFRYRMDIVPLQPSLVGGSHGLNPTDPQQGPLILGPGQLPTCMSEFAAYAEGILGS